MNGPLVVVGDALLDVDLIGDASRLTPDAPVPVVQVDHESARPGGAGLTAVLARRLADDRDRDVAVVLVAPIADDAAGERLRALLEEAGVQLVPVRHGGSTVVKRRIRAGGQSIARLDEGSQPMLDKLPGEARAAIAEASTVLVSDYGQGMSATPGLADALRGLRAPIVWDPHPRGARPVAGCRLITPSQAEAEALTADVSTSGSTLAGLAARAGALVERWQAHAVTLTLGDRGALLAQPDAVPSVVPAQRPVRAGDACGAGDCFAASAALTMLAGGLTSEAVQAAVADATRFVEDGGASGLARQRTGPRPGESIESVHELVARVHARGGEVIATGGCFDLLHAGHVAMLNAARSLGDALVVLLNSDASVRRLKGPTRPIVPAADRARVLAALDAVDAVVVFDEDTPEQALRDLRPDVWAKGGDYAIEQLTERAVLEQWGGTTVVLPYLDGRSTTRLVTQATRR